VRSLVSRRSAISCRESPFQQQQADIRLGVRQPPGRKLPRNGNAQSLHKLTVFCLPASGILARIGQRAAQTPKTPQHGPQPERCGDQNDQLCRKMPRAGAFSAVGDQVCPDEQGNRAKQHGNAQTGLCVRIRHLTYALLAQSAAKGNASM
jgi:hypothetical protein